MRLQQRASLTEIYKSVLAVALIFMFIFMILNVVPKAGAVASTSGTNATLIIFDDGDKQFVQPGTNISNGLEVNNLFNDTSNVHFYANYSNGTGFSMQADGGTKCNIEFESGATSTPGPFLMANNASLNLLEYNKSFSRNGTYIWNVTCSNGNAGTATLRAYDTVRIFGPGCVAPTLNFALVNNTILCGGTYNVLANLGEALFIIKNNNVTLDCNSSIIRGKSQGVAIDAGAFNGTIIKNCYLENYTDSFVSAANSFKDYTLLFNNSFANNTFGPNFTKMGNLSIYANNFTNLTTNGFYALNITNATAIGNRFCNNGRPTTTMENANITFNNNTLCVTLTTPINNTDQNDINFTFNVPSLTNARTCDLITSPGGLAGRVNVGGANELNVNVTLNRSYFVGDLITWSVNCTDKGNNGELSATFNTTFRSCTIPTIGLAAPQSLNVTFCPGIFEMNLSATEVVYLIGLSNDTVTSCNNTFFRGVGLGDLFRVGDSGGNRVKIQNCYGSNFSAGIRTPVASSSTNITFFNNTFVNMSVFGAHIEAQGFNLTNNTFQNAGRGIELVNGGRSFIINNTIFNSSAMGIILVNSSNNTIIANNISNSREQGMIIAAGPIITSLATQPNFENLIVNNTICSSTKEGLLINNTRFSNSPVLDGLVANNTFCNTTTGNTNALIAKLIWNFEINVVNATNTSMVSANINITDNFSQNVSSDLLTNSTGFTSVLNITQFVVNNSAIVVNYTPSYFVAAKNNEKTNLTFAINQIRTLVLGNPFILNLSQDNTAPNVTQISPTSVNEDINVNFTATVVDQTGIKACSFFSGSSSTSTTNQGAMTYSLSNGIVNKTFLYADPGTYFVYANCTDNGDNIGFNMTTLSVNDTTFPNVTTIRPIANNFTRLNAIVNISATVVDNALVDTVLVNITYPDNTTKEQLRLTNISSIYNFSFANTTQQGTYNITFIANDTGRNINSTEKTNITVDAVAPAVVGLRPIANNFTRLNAIVNISATVTDGLSGMDIVLANVTYPDNTTKEQLRLVKVGNIYNFSFANTTQAGTYNITFIANDTVNNINSSEKTNITVDNVAPTVITLRPIANNFTGTSTTVNISATVTEGLSGVDIVLANVTYPNNTTKEQLRLMKIGDIYNFSFANTSTEGYYNVTFIANDTVNNINSSEKTNFTVDSTGPAVRNITPSATNQQVVNGTIINISANVTDQFLNVNTVLVNVTYPDNTTKEQLRLTNMGSSYNFSFVNTTTHGVYNVTFIANDTAGNLNTTEKTNFTIDEQNPVVSQVMPTSGTEGVSIPFNATVTDNINVSSCSLFFGTSNTSTENQGTMTLNGSQVSRSITFSGGNTYFVYANCTDTSNNIGFNITTVAIAAATAGGGTSGEESSSSESSPTSGTAAPTTTTPTTETTETPATETAPAAEEAAPAGEAAAESGGEGEQGGNDEEIIQELKEGNLLALEYGLEIEKITANGELVYENGEQQNTITVKDYDNLDIQVTLKNVNEGVVNDIEINVGDLPEGVEIESIDPESVDALNPGEEKEITVHIVTTEVAETFIFEIKFIAEKASATLGVSTVLEAGRGSYYTRQRVIEETQEVLVRTYKFLFLLFLIPILLLLRMTSITDEKAVRILIEQKKLADFWRIYVSEAVYPKYNMFENIKQVEMDDEDEQKAAEISRKEKISYELASLIVFASKKLIPRVFTKEEVSKELRHKYPRILFTSPLRDFREDQLQRYIETQTKKGYTNSEMREVLLQAGWKPEIVKKYLDPEKDLDVYINEQKQKGKSLGDIKKILVDAKWDKQIVEKHLPKQAVMKEYIDLQRKKGIINSEIRKQLLAVGWEKELVQKYLSAENDLKAYIVGQQQKGISSQELKKKLLQKGWKKEIVEKLVKK